MPSMASHSARRRRRRASVGLRLESLEPRTLLAVDASVGLASAAWFRTLVPANRAPAAATGVSSLSLGGASGSASSAATSEYVVRFNNTALKTIGSVADAANALANPTLGVQVVKGLGLPGQVLVRASGAASAVTNFLKSNPLVAYAEPNTNIQSMASVPNDPRYTDGSLWGLNNTGQSGGKVDADIDAPEAWQITTGSDTVVVAVIDTGTDINHPDLRDNIWVNPGEIANDGIDNDANGFVDDVNGWDFYFNDASVYDGPDDDHGTHCAGTIAGRGNNGTGVVGVSWNTKIMPVKFLGPFGGFMSDAIAAVNYVTMMKSMGVNIRISSNSWGGRGYSQGLKDAIEAGGRANILFVAAAGNSGVNNDAIPHYPSSYDSTCIIAVAATDRNDSLASFSCFGKTSVDLAAPGVSILSTTPENTYSYFDGTSMATPHVSGVAALTVALDPSITVPELKAAILGGVDVIPSLANKMVTGGRLNAKNTLELARPALKLVSSSPGGRVTGPVSQITLTFNQEVDAASLVTSNFLLTGDGDDGDFGTADDVSVAVSSVAQTAPGTLVLSVTTPLASAERYRLTLKGTGNNPLKAANGRPLVRSGGGFTAADVVSNFAVWPVENDANDAIITARQITKKSGLLAIESTLGNGQYPARDVDLFKVDLAAGQSFTIDINARTLADGSRLDSVLRLFDTNGAQVAFNDDDGVTVDSFIQYTAPAAGSYYVGVSGFGNMAYRPAAAGSGATGSLGDYQIVLGFGSTPLTADIVDIAPDPRDQAVGSVTITFNRAVTGFDIGDLSLTRDGGAVSIAEAMLTSSADGMTWTLGGPQLATATGQSGSYRLAVNHAGRGIMDSAGVQLSATAVDEWRTTIAGPPVPPSAPDAGDTIATAATPAPPAAGRPAVVTGRIGDGAQRSMDVDLYAVTVAAGQTLQIDVDAFSLTPRSTLDSVVRVFTATGSLVAFNDNDVRPGQASRDSFLEIKIAVAGRYFIGVSGAGNAGYAPTSLTGRRAGSVGDYTLKIALNGAGSSPTALAFAVLAAEPTTSSPSTPKKRF